MNRHRPRDVAPDETAAQTDGEAQRLLALRRYAILDTPAEPAFDRIAALLRDLFGTPIGLVSLIDETRQWFKARIGVEVREVPRAQAFCDFTILPAGREGALVIEDLSADPRFRDNPLVAGEPHFRFYAGAPIVTPAGECIGTVSVLCFTPRPAGVSLAQRRWLRTMAAMATDELELRLQARLAQEAAARAEAAMQDAAAALAAEARLRRAQEAAGVVAFEFGPGGGAEGHGPALGAALRALHGLPPDGPLDPAAALTVVHPDDRAAMAATLERLAAQGGPFEQEYRVLLPEGGLRWLQLRGALRPPGDGRPGPPWRVAGVAQDVTARRSAEEVRTLLAREVDHRAKNALAVVQAALRLTPKDDPAAYAAAIEGRIAALARAHALLARQRWEAADLGAIIEAELAPFLRKAKDPAEAALAANPRARLEGAAITLAPHAVQPLAMVVHELATNATKHGALSATEGWLEVAWSLEPVAGGVVLRWTERGGPPVAGPPARRGFGSRLLETTIERQLGGTLECRWESAGLACEIRVPAARVLSGAG
ncbi:HWE histidine kinase domain-containing protein [Roseicella aerolata]|uniref:histidine kinase n=1 Tax=Roseicella aerolata TaxID=2883479 RepID=A0A9X1IBS9_9PROT|nr:HWE histidine kinase domain-containing protein [Roseicella aerolata]MCB4820994.1 PAS domain-containing protein [Roseicella aerolata]